MSRTQKFMKNTIATALLQLVIMMSGFVIPRIMLSFYGSEINGLVTSITQLIAYITLIEAGLSNATVYSLYKPLSENNTSKINSILSAARNLYNKSGYIFLGLSIAVALIYPMFIKSDILSYYEVVFLFFILAINGVLEFFSLSKYRALLTADQKIYVISLASIVQVIINVAIVSVFSLVGANIVVTRLVAIVAILIRTIILWLYCRGKYKYLDFNVEPDNLSLDKRWDALYLQIIGVVHTGAPVLIATFLLDLEDVSVYSIYNIVLIGINGILGIFTNGLYASFGDLIVRGDSKRFKNAFMQFEYSYYIIITIIYSVMLITFLPFINIYTMGADINYSYPMLAILMTVNGYLHNLKTPYGMLTIAAGKYRESRVQITIQGLLEIVLGVIFCYLWGLEGIILGSILSNLYRDIDFVFFAPKHLTHYGFGKTLLMWLRSIVIIIIMVSIGKAMPNIRDLSYLSWIKYASVISIISLIFTLVVNVITDFNMFKLIFARLKNTLIFKKRGVNEL